MAKPKKKRGPRYPNIRDDDPRIEVWLDARAKLGETTREAAKRVGVTNAGLCQWKICPVERVLQIEELTGVSRYKLRPDIYGTEPVSEAAA